MASSSAALQIASTGSALILTPLLILALGAEGFGAFSTVMTVPALIAVADLGLGNGLVTPLASALERGDIATARRLVSSTRIVLAAVGGGSLALVAVVALIGSQSSAGDSVLLAGGVVAASFVALALPLSIAYRARLSVYSAQWSTSCQVVGTLVGFVACLIVIATNPSVTAAVGCLLGGRLVGLLVDTLWTRHHYPDWFVSSLRDYDGRTVAALARVGIWFFLLQLSGLVAYQIDLWVVTAILGSAEAGAFAVLQRLFALAPLAAGFILAPMWPAYARAISRGDGRWVRRWFRRTVMVTVVINGGWTLLLLLGGEHIVGWWLGDGAAMIVIPSSLWFALGLWTLLNCVTGPVAMLLNGAGVVRPQVAAALAMAAVNLVLSVLLTRQVGLSGPAWGSVLAQSLVVIPVSLLLTRSLMRGLHDGPDGASGVPAPTGEPYS